MRRLRPARWRRPRGGSPGVWRRAGRSPSPPRGAPRSSWRWGASLAARRRPPSRETQAPQRRRGGRGPSCRACAGGGQTLAGAGGARNFFPLATRLSVFAPSPARSCRSLCQTARRSGVNRSGGASKRRSKESRGEYATPRTSNRSPSTSSDDPATETVVEHLAISAGRSERSRFRHRWSSRSIVTERCSIKSCRCSRVTVSTRHR